jgi:hypothetical protein
MGMTSAEAACTGMTSADGACTRMTSAEAAGDAASPRCEGAAPS